MTKVGIFITVTENQDKEILKINSSGTHNWQTLSRTQSFDCIMTKSALIFNVIIFLLSWIEQIIVVDYSLLELITICWH